MRKYEQPCPIARTLDIIGDRWTVLVVRDLLMGRTKFSELRDSLDGIPPKLLSARLKMLMGEGLLDRTIYSEHPLRADYRLTEKGRSLVPILLAMGEWGLGNLFEGEAQLRDHVAAAIYDRIPETREALVEAGFVQGRTATD